MSHTPGPWTVMEDGTDYSILVSSEKSGIAQVYSSDEPGWVGFDAGEANARLIAAAPDLYEALKCILPWVKFEPDELEGQARLRDARAAIAKVQGKS